jgi:hypothetical protein
MAGLRRFHFEISKICSSLPWRVRTDSVLAVSPCWVRSKFVFWSGLGLVSCAYEEARLAAVRPDAEVFEAEVYPVLLRDCAFSGCHGDSQRFFRIYGPGRTRIDDSLENYDPPTEREVEHTYERARSMLRGVRGIDDSLFLRKPLDSSEGGAGKGHQGTDVWGHNVYRSKDDLAYQTLVKWAQSAESGEEVKAP